MLLHQDHLFSIFFGDKRTAITAGQCSIDNMQLAAPTKFLHLQHLAILKQTHSTDGLLITEPTIVPYAHEGDYLITQLKQVGLAVITADCLPILLFDPITQTIAAIHAGWRGSVDDIATQALKHMQRACHVNAASVQVFFGPSAKTCCYEVSEDFAVKYATQETGACAIKRHNQWYFDVPLYNKIKLMHAGVPATAFHTTYNICTICNPAFCSYRRDMQSAQRQVTIIALT
jgi:uncharacterized protein, YfiH family